MGKCIYWVPPRYVVYLYIQWTYPCNISMMNTLSHLSTLGLYLSAAPVGGPSPPEPPKLPRTRPRPSVSEPLFHDSPTIPRSGRATGNISSVRVLSAHFEKLRHPIQFDSIPTPSPQPLSAPRSSHPSRPGIGPNGAQPMHAAAAAAPSSSSSPTKTQPRRPPGFDPSLPPLGSRIKAAKLPSMPQGACISRAAEAMHGTFRSLRALPQQQGAPSALGHCLRWEEDDRPARTDLIRIPGRFHWRRGREYPVL